MIRPQAKRRKKGWHVRGPAIKRDCCFVYFFKAEVSAEALIKIGFTSGDVERRCNVLRLGSPVELTVAGFFEGTQQDELNLHRQFAHLRRHREWFLLDDELAQEIERRCHGD